MDAGWRCLDSRHPPADWPSVVTGSSLWGGSATVSFHVRRDTALEDLPRLSQTMKATLELDVQTAGLDPFTWSETIQLQRDPEDDSSRGMTWSMG